MNKNAAIIVVKENVFIRLDKLKKEVKKYCRNWVEEEGEEEQQMLDFTLFRSKSHLLFWL